MSIPTCPTNCDAEQPQVSFSNCNPEINLSQINRIYITKADAPLSDWTDPSEWATRISNTSTNDNAIREITVIGDKPLPEAQEVEISDQRTRALNKNHVLNFDIDESNATNHAAVRQLECGGDMLLWYGTIGGKLFGSTDGIKVSLTGGMVLGRGSGDVQKYTFSAKWKSNFTELMIDNPIA